MIESLLHDRLGLTCMRRFEYLGLMRYLTLALLFASPPLWAASLTPAPSPIVELRSSDLGTIQFLSTSGAWPTGQTARLSVTHSPETAQDFDTTFTGDRKTQKRLPGEVRIQTGKQRPRSSVTVRWVLPPQHVTVTTPVVLAQFLYDSETESHDYFTEIPSTYNSANHELKATIEPKYFTDERGDSGQFEAILVIVTEQKK